MNTEGVKKFLKKTLQFLESKIYGPVAWVSRKKKQLVFILTEVFGICGLLRVFAIYLKANVKNGGKRHCTLLGLYSEMLGWLYWFPGFFNTFSIKFALLQNNRFKDKLHTSLTIKIGRKNFETRKTLVPVLCAKSLN